MRGKISDSTLVRGMKIPDGGLVRGMKISNGVLVSLNGKYVSLTNLVSHQRTSGYGAAV